MNIKEKLEDLLIQATKERSHYYVASTVKEAIFCIHTLEFELRDYKKSMEMARGMIADKDKRIDALNKELIDLSIQQQYELETWNKEVERLKEELAHVKDILLKIFLDLEVNIKVES
jgi:hypothetical protein